MCTNRRWNYFALAAVLFFSIGGYVGLSAAPERKQQGGGERIKLNHADLLTYDVKIRPDVQRLIGHVSFTHGSATMTCDSAYLNEKEQVFEAFGNVHMMQADTVHMYGQYLHYDGKTKLARLRRQVKLENTTTTVFTDSLDYDRVADMAYYFEGGTIVDPQNTLTSDYGQYYPQTNDAEFRYNVKLVNDSTEMTTQHLYYNTRTRIGSYNGDTQIRNDSGLIVSTRGVYDLNKNVGILLNRSEVYSRDRMLVGDSIYYDGTTEFGEAFGDMGLHDTLRRISLYGDYGYFDANRNYGFATSRAYALDYSQRDTLYIGADTLELISFQYDVLADTSNLYPAKLQRDTIQRELRAHRHVKVFRNDGQAVADSMAYSTRDSVLRLFGNPLLWQEMRQVSGDTIFFFFEQKKLKYADVLGHVFATEQMPDKPDYYNQIRASKIRTYMDDSVVSEVNAEGEQVESIYYMKENGRTDYSGMNRMISTGMIAKLDSANRPKHTLWTGEVTGKVYPIDMAIQQGVTRLEGFSWSPELRPKHPEDVVSKEIGKEGYTLGALERFDGAKAALAIYTPHETQQKELRQTADSLRTKVEQELGSYDYPYVRRSTKASEPQYLRRANQLLDTKTWRYNPSSVLADPKPSNTNISITIPERKRLPDESNASAISSSKTGK